MKRTKLHRQIEAQVPRKVLRDIANRLRYGHGAPISDEVIFMNPRAPIFNFARGAKKPRRHDSGRIVAGDWDRQIVKFQKKSPKYKAIKRRYRKGLSWEETGLFDYILQRIAQHGVFDDCRNIHDIRKRYEAMDRMVDQVMRNGALDIRSLRPDAFRREHGGILMHIDRNGRGIRSGGGMHRFAIARVLKLKEIPLQVGMVHRDAVLSGAYEKLRQSEIYDTPPK